MDLNSLSILLNDCLNKSLNLNLFNNNLQKNIIDTEKINKLFNFIIIIFNEYLIIKSKNLTSEKNSNYNEDDKIYEDEEDDEDKDEEEEEEDDEDKDSDDKKYLQIVQNFIDKFHKNLTNNKITKKQRIAYIKFVKYYEYLVDNDRDIYNAKINDIIIIILVELNSQYNSFNNIQDYANVNNIITIKNRYNNKEYNINLTEYLYAWYNLYFINNN